MNVQVGDPWPNPIPTGIGPLWYGPHYQPNYGAYPNVPPSLTEDRIREIFREELAKALKEFKP